jgi:site-specific DNA recombinase
MRELESAHGNAATSPEVAARGMYGGDAHAPPVRNLHAVIYLRVSTAGQVNTDRDGEGFSIPAQREACLRKSEALGADVVDQYVDAGESARSASRPQLQAMLARLAMGDIDYVIVHKVDRLARNRADDVAINLAIRDSGAVLVSCTENIDETPSGTLLHGIMSSIAEFYSKNLAAEVSKGMSQKAKKGGFPSRAPIGYLNVREMVNGNEIRIVVIDEERAPHVRWAYEAYASGDYPLRRLTAELAERGLRSQATRKGPPKALQLASVHRLLSNPAYVGFVDYKGERYAGLHQPIVSPELWDRVQELLASRTRSGERRREFNHYLKGTIFCSRCTRRLCFIRATGKQGGKYDYFFCSGRHSGNGCDLPYLPVAVVESRIEALHQTVSLSVEETEKVRRMLSKKLRELSSQVGKEASSQRLRIQRLEAERRRLLRAHLDGAVPLDLLKEEQARLGTELADAEALVRRSSMEWDQIDKNLTRVMSVLANCGQTYRDAKPEVRRGLNQAFFDGVFIDVDDLPYTRLAEPFTHVIRDAPPEPPREDGTHKPRPHCYGRGSNKDHLVELMGLEPTTPCLQSRCSSQLSYSPVTGSGAGWKPPVREPEVGTKPSGRRGRGMNLRGSRSPARSRRSGFC